MRHGMRSYTTGSAWWHGDCGPFWGHNAIIRMRPFKEYCALPMIPGNHALSGYVLSHDQVEAVLMRRAGYEVRVIAQEDESWEDNPPTLPDFIKRDLRWCQGNMQYWWLLRMEGLPIMSRVQLLLAILMYVGAPGWMLFIVLGIVQVAFYPVSAFPIEVGLGLFLAVISMSLMPKIVGILDVLTSQESRRRYGGGIRVLAGAFLEFLLSALLAPIVSFAQSRFMIGLVFGKTIGWGAQRRESVDLGFWEACRGLWPQTLFGVALLLSLSLTMPSLILFAAPVLLSLIGAVPLAVGTASFRLHRLSTKIGLCDIPEDRIAAPTLERLPKGV
jgi:membrane glycosyltransferase